MRPTAAYGVAWSVYWSRPPPPLHHSKTDGPQVSRYWAQARVYKMGCALAPPGEYDELIDAAAAMWTVATVMSMYAQSRTETVSLLAPPG